MLSLTHIFALLGIAAGLMKELGQAYMAKSWQAFTWDSYGMKDGPSSLMHYDRCGGKAPISTYRLHVVSTKQQVSTSTGVLWV